MQKQVIGKRLRVFNFDHCIKGRETSMATNAAKIFKTLVVDSEQERREA